MQTLKKVKKKANGGLDVELNNPNQLKNPPRKSTNEYDTIPHPDLLHALDGLKIYLAKTFSLFFFEKWGVNDLFNKQEVSAVRDLDQKFKEEKIRIHESIEVNGMCLVGDNDSLSVKILGTIRCGHTPVSINTPNILLSGDVFHFEPLLKKQVELIEFESLEYVNGNKKGEAKPIEEEDGNLFTKPLKDAVGDYPNDTTEEQKGYTEALQKESAKGKKKPAPKTGKKK